jgi:hypothetical protein
MRLALCSAVTTLLIVAPAEAESPLEQGFAATFRGCEAWVLDPKTWASGMGPFVSAVGLGEQMGLVAQVDEASLPPQELRVANHYWRINSTPGAGFVLVVSDRLPMCHITGGGDTDLQPAVEAVLGGKAFAARWVKTGEHVRGEMKMTEYRSREDAAFSLLVSRADQPGQRLDRVQVIATATYKLSK